MINKEIYYIGDKLTFSELRQVLDIRYISKLEINSLPIKKKSVLFLEAFWLGVDLSWGIKNNEDIKKYANLILEIKNKNNMYVIYFAKEDAIFLERFLPLGNVADLIVTVNQNSISTYKNYFPTKEIIFNHFFVNFDNVIDLKNFKKNKKSIFYGTLNNQFDKRKEDLFQTIDSLSQFECDIFERGNKKQYFHQNLKKSVFPEIDNQLVVKKVSTYNSSIYANSSEQFDRFLPRRIAETASSGIDIMVNKNKISEFKTLESELGIDFISKNDDFNDKEFNLIKEQKKIDNFSTISFLKKIKLDHLVLKNSKIKNIRFIYYKDLHNKKIMNFVDSENEEIFVLTKSKIFKGNQNLLINFLRKIKINENLFFNYDKNHILRFFEEKKINMIVSSNFVNLLKNINIFNDI